MIRILNILLFDGPEVNPGRAIDIGGETGCSSSSRSRKINRAFGSGTEGDQVKYGGARTPFSSIPFRCSPIPPIPLSLLVLAAQEEETGRCQHSVQT